MKKLPRNSVTVGELVTAERASVVHVFISSLACINVKSARA